MPFIALRELIRRVYPPRTVAITVVVSVIVWFAGPIGTFEAMGPAFRLVYWGGLIMGSVPFAYAFRRAISRRLPDLTPWALAILVATGFSFAYTPIVYGATFLAARYELARMVPVSTMWLGTFLAAAAAYLVRALMMGAQPAPQPGLRRLPPSGPRLLARLEPAVQGRLVSISVRDHYVDVRTEAGQVSLLMRFSDAVAETEGEDGAQVHRSHWVAWSAVRAVERQGSGLALQMVQGAAIPVSRNHRDKLERRGLLSVPERTS